MKQPNIFDGFLQKILLDRRYTLDRRRNRRRGKSGEEAIRQVAPPADKLKKVPFGTFLNNNYFFFIYLQDVQ